MKRRMMGLEEWEVAMTSSTRKRRAIRSPKLPLLSKRMIELRPKTQNYKKNRKSYRKSCKSRCKRKRKKLNRSVKKRKLIKRNQR